MKQSEAAEFLPIIKAWSEGKTIQLQRINDWIDSTGETPLIFDAPVKYYRIKPEPRIFYVAHQNGNNGGWAYPTEEYAKLEISKCSEVEIIKVQEVL